MGVSQNSGAVLAAARADGRIRGVVVDSPFRSPAAEVEDLTCWVPGGPAGWFPRATLAWASLGQGCNLFEQSAGRDIAEVSPRPVLLICGQDDPVVPVGEVEALYRAARDPAMLWKVPGARHAEALACRPAQYAEVVAKMLQSVRMGLPPFGWARDAKSAS